MKLGLGTVQFGLNYGVSNENGIVSKSDVLAILETAKCNDITLLDTASAYGESEAVLGTLINSYDHFDIITKTPVFDEDVITDESILLLHDQLNISLDHLSVNKIHGLLIHHAEDLLKAGGDKLVEALEAVKNKGLVENVGVSVYSPEQLRKVIPLFTPDIVQAPLNIFDQRFVSHEIYFALKKAGVQFHFRSVFLQGLLLMAQEKRPAWTRNYMGAFQRYDALVEESKLTRLEICLGFLARQVNDDVTLVGVTGSDELESILAAFNRKTDITELQYRSLSSSDEGLVNPSLWSIS